MILPQFVSQLNSEHLGAQIEKILPLLEETYLAGRPHPPPANGEEGGKHPSAALAALLSVVSVVASALLVEACDDSDRGAVMGSFFSAGGEPLGQVSLSLKRVAESRPQEYSQEQRALFREQGEKAKKYFGWVLGANYPEQEWVKDMDALFSSGEKNGLEKLCDKFLYVFWGVFPGGMPGGAVWTYTDEEGGIWEGQVKFSPDRDVERAESFEGPVL